MHDGGGISEGVNPNSIMLVLKVGLKNAQTHQVLQFPPHPPCLSCISIFLASADFSIQLLIPLPRQARLKQPLSIPKQHTLDTITSF